MSIAAVIGTAAVDSGLYLKQSEVHGMSQRGGAVQSHLRISDKPVASDLIPEGDCDIILSVEPLEGLRYLPFLNKSGWLITNSVPFINIDNYPDPEKLNSYIKSFQNHILVDAESIAKDLGSIKVSNMVMLGAAASLLGLSQEMLDESIRILFGKKGDEIVELNIEAVKNGRMAAKK